MSAVLPAGGPLFHPASPRFSDKCSHHTSFMTHLMSVNASPSARETVRAPVPGKYFAACAERGLVKRMNIVRAPAAKPAGSSSAKKSADRPKTISSARSSGRPASSLTARRKKKVKTKTSYYVKSTTNTFSLVKITAERSEKTYADRQKQQAASSCRGNGLNRPTLHALIHLRDFNKVIGKIINAHLYLKR